MAKIILGDGFSPKWNHHSVFPGALFVDPISGDACIVRAIVPGSSAYRVVSLDDGTELEQDTSRGKELTAALLRRKGYRPLTLNESLVLKQEPQ